MPDTGVITLCRLTFEGPKGEQLQLQASAVVLTVPAYVAAGILGDLAPAAAALLESIAYPPIAAVILSYPTSAIRPQFLDEEGQLAGRAGCRMERWMRAVDLSVGARLHCEILPALNHTHHTHTATFGSLGFGQLHPRGQGLTTLGSIYAGSLFPGRAAPGRVILCNFLGGAREPEVASWSDDRLVDQASEGGRNVHWDSNGIIDAVACDCTSS